MGHALRLARREPAFAALVVLTLAVGIGATTAALDVADDMLVSPLPVADEARLLLIRQELRGSATALPFSYAEMAAFRDASRTLAGVGGVQYDGAWGGTAELGDRTLRVTGTTVSGEFFEVLGVRPARRGPSSSGMDSGSGSAAAIPPCSDGGFARAAGPPRSSA